MSDTDQNSGYQVLARKYRPATFADLIGQDAMVRTLKNAFDAGRIAQAFIMTGIRGTGKTTTARIIAKGMNCVGADGTGGPTTDPCGVCDNCVAIAEGRHVDVMEMDAASRTGVGDIREIIDSVHYRAASARYKIYIIDEVHMLSTSAFNALLKTLEEPPEHVKFIFATTEIRKVPVTVLSRCQRFDLRRIEPEVMIAHLASVAGKESAEIAEDALALITRAAEGSVRDAMSLMDQAISHGAGETTALQVRAMLGLADRGRVLDLFDLIMKGDAAGAIQELSSQYADGADPMAVLRCVQLAHYEPGRIEFVPTPDAPNDLASKLGARLQQWTGQRWAVTLVNEGGAATVAAERDAETNALKAEAQAHPMMQAVLQAFPTAKILEVKTPLLHLPLPDPAGRHRCRTQVPQPMGRPCRRGPVDHAHHRFHRHRPHRHRRICPIRGLRRLARLVHRRRRCNMCGDSSIHPAAQNAALTR